MLTQSISSTTRYIVCVLALLVTVLFWHQSHVAADGTDPIKVTLDLEELEFMVDPVIRPPGTTLVPFRTIFEAFGMEVEWEPTQRLVTGKNDEISISLIIGDDTATVNNKTVKLQRAPEIIQGNTMVPIRFIAESTGASVFWDPYNRAIDIVTLDFMSANNITPEQLEEAVNEYLATREQEEREKAEEKAREQEKQEKEENSKPSKPAKVVDLNHLDGMYYGFRSDIGGYECGGICWDFYTFLPNNQVFIGIPEKGGPETINCSTDECLDYTIKNGQLQLSNGESLSIQKSENGFLTIEDVRLDSVLPTPSELTLDDTYRYMGYTGLIGITGAASSWTYDLTLHADGTFELSGVTLGSVGANLPSGPTTHGSSSDADNGTYEISGNTITLTANDGTVTKELFFIHNTSTPDHYDDIQVGDKNYYID